MHPVPMPATGGIFARQQAKRWKFSLFLRLTPVFYTITTVSGFYFNLFPEKHHISIYSKALPAQYV